MDVSIDKFAGFEAMFDASGRPFGSTRNLAGGLVHVVRQIGIVGSGTAAMQLSPKSTSKT